MAKTKRRKLYEKARNIVRNNMSESKGVTVTAKQSPSVVKAFTKFQSERGGAVAAQPKKKAVKKTTPMKRAKKTNRIVE
jgi:hypothetical protein